jgi:uncharacterized repeat protein (TIGR01451 family)
MKRIKSMAAALLMSATLIAPLLAVVPAQAAQVVSLRCDYSEEILSEIGISGCDLSLAKQVSVNGGEYQDADTAAQTAQAKIGDTITWKITVTNTSEQGYEPFGIVTVHDIPPTGVTVTGSSASTGTYSNGDWTFTVEGNLPATLVITSTANTSGQLENTAAFTDYTPEDCPGGPCIDPPYVDSNSANNSNSAFVNVAAPVNTVAVIAPAAPSTGYGVALKNPWTALALSTTGASGLLGTAYGIRRYAAKKTAS